MDGSRILVIDDSTTLRKLVEIAMRGTGYNIDFAASGSDGVLRARTHRPDVILLDYLLPDLRSREVCQRLCDDTTTSNVPVVIMSANQRNVLDDFRPFSSVVGFIGKPFTANEIRTRLEGVVRSGGRLARGTSDTLHDQPISSSASIASGSTGGAEPDGALVLRGDLAAAPLLDVLRLLAAAHATGALVVDSFGEPAGSARLWLRRGEIWMGAGPNAEPGAPGEPLPELTRELHDRITQNLVVGKPALITLAEAGLARANLALELHAASARLVGELLDARSGRFAWETAATLPDFVEAFGRHVSLTAIALDHARRTAAVEPGVVEAIYDRTARFSEKLAGAKLSSDEQRVLGLVDGKTSGRDAVARAKLPADRGAEILSRLATADLIRPAAAPRSASRALAVLDGAGDELVAALRAGLSRRAQPIDVIALDPTRPLAAATLEARPAVVLVGITALSRHALEHELPLIARDSTTAVVCVLDSPNPPLAAQLLGAGLHAVLTKPVHLTEIERLLSG